MRDGAAAIYAKGGDYTVESLDPDERAALRAAGTRDPHPAAGARQIDHRASLGASAR